MQPFCLVLARTHQNVPFVYEADPERDSREIKALDILHGEHDTGRIEHVIEVDVASGTSRDISREIAGMVAALSFEKESPPSPSAARFVALFDIPCFTVPEPVSAGAYHVGFR